MADTPLRTLSVVLEANAAPMRDSLTEAEKIVSDAMGKMESSFEGVKSSMDDLAAGAAGLRTALAAILSGVSLAALVKFIHDANRELVDLDNSAKLAGVSLERLQSLQFAGAIGGMKGKDITSGLEQLGKLLDEASRKENDLTKWFDANNVQWKDIDGHVVDTSKAFGIIADMIRNAPTERMKVDIAEMAGFSKEAVPFLEKGADAINQVAAGAKEAGAVTDRELVDKAHKFVEQWNEASTLWVTRMQAAIGDIMPGMLSLLDVSGKFLAGFLQGLATLGRVVGAVTGLSSPSGPVAAAIAGRLGSTAGAAAFGAAITPTKRPPEEESDEKNALDTAIDRLQRRIELLNAETTSVGLNTEAKEKARATAELLAAAGRDEETVTDETRQKIDAMAETYAKAAAKAHDALMSFQSFNEALRFGGDMLVNIVDGLITKTQTLQQVAQNALRALIQALLQAELLGSGPLAGILGTKSATGGVGGLLGSIFPFPGAGGGAAVAAGIDGTFAEGGDVSIGRRYLVGERGPELFIPSASGRIDPNIGGGRTQVNVITPPGSSVEQRQRNQGDVEILDLVISAMDQKLATGRFDRTMGVRFGLTPGAIRR